MELRSRILAEVEVGALPRPWQVYENAGDPDPWVPGPSPLVTEGSGEPVPDLSLIHI